MLKIFQLLLLASLATINATNFNNNNDSYYLDQELVEELRVTSEMEAKEKLKPKYKVHENNLLITKKVDKKNYETVLLESKRTVVLIKSSLGELISQEVDKIVIEFQKDITKLISELETSNARIAELEEECSNLKMELREIIVINYIAVRKSELVEIEEESLSDSIGLSAL